MGLRSSFDKAAAVVGRMGAGEVLSTRGMRIDRGLTVLPFNVDRHPETGEVFGPMGLLGGGSQRWFGA